MATLDNTKKAKLQLEHPNHPSTAEPSSDIVVTVRRDGAETSTSNARNEEAKYVACPVLRATLMISCVGSCTARCQGYKPS